ncbi:unnamed protein product [Caenorhabditis auriculariae]|uniref:Uncharacterized protein n=1 Tax=Caenorhabditis auriculariae TaxID=2777116 RepID=A0A8S1HHY4_9PELO|nr:unnamed protein product [Caenorhabditis auriculariae]
MYRNKLHGDRIDCKEIGKKDGPISSQRQSRSMAAKEPVDSLKTNNYASKSFKSVTSTDKQGDSVADTKEPSTAGSRATKRCPKTSLPIPSRETPVTCQKSRNPAAKTTHASLSCNEAKKSKGKLSSSLPIPVETESTESPVPEIDMNSFTWELASRAHIYAVSENASRFEFDFHEAWEMLKEEDANKKKCIVDISKKGNENLVGTLGNNGKHMGFLAAPSHTASTGPELTKVTLSKTLKQESFYQVNFLPSQDFVRRSFFISSMFF